MLMITNGKQILLEQRPGQGIWAGLWCFPQTDALDDAKAIHKSWITHKDTQAWDAFRHTFSHYHLDITPVHIQGKIKPVSNLGEQTQYRWFELSSDIKVGLAAPVKKLLEKLSQGL